MPHLLSVNVGAPQLLPGSTAPTGIIKTPRTGPVLIDASGVLGDAVMDRRHHGGVDQAVYIYLQSDYDFWAAELGELPAPGTFGENLTIAGIAGETLCVGDRLQIGDVLLEITSHRTPCNTFARRMGDRGWVKRFQRALRPGAYMRVLAGGSVEAGMEVGYMPFGGERVTLAEFMAVVAMRIIPDATMRRFLAAPVHYKTRADFEAALALR